MQRLAMALIRGYQRFISPFLPAHCRFTPTCSEYMLTAIQLHGTRRGLWLGSKRLARCHPFSGCYGFDPVPQAASAESVANVKVNSENSTCKHGNSANG